jgi:hypothetical protein
MAKMKKSEEIRFYLFFLNLPSSITPEVPRILATSGSNCG